MEIRYGGIPGRPIGDGMDGHSWWPLFENIPTEYLEAYYPLRIDGYTTVTDSGGAGFHRGGNGVEKRYVYLEPGEISIHDDRWLTRPWGVLGGEPGGRSEKILRRADGSEERLPSKCDHVVVEPGDMLIYRTAGGGGWKDRLDRPVEAVVRDVSFGLVSREKAKAGYGVVLNDDGSTDPASPLVCDLDAVVVAIQRLLGETRAAGFPVAYTTVSYTQADRRTAAAFIDKVPALQVLEAGSRWVEIDPRITPLPNEP